MDTISSNKLHKSDRVRKNTIIIMCLVIGLLFISWVFHYFNTYHIKNLDKFSGNLFNYPLPPQTVILEKEKYGGSNWVYGGSSGGYWNVVAIIKLSTQLSKQEIIDYYKDVKFPYLKTNKPNMVEPEIFFGDDAKRIVSKEGGYYMSKDGIMKPVSSYTDNNFKDEGTKNSVYILQIVDGYDYFFNLN